MVWMNVIESRQVIDGPRLKLQVSAFYCMLICCDLCPVHLHFEELSTGVVLVQVICCICCILYYLYAEYGAFTLIFIMQAWIGCSTVSDRSSFHQFMESLYSMNCAILLSNWIMYIWITTLFGHSLIIFLVLHVLLCISMFPGIAPGWGLEPNI